MAYLLSQRGDYSKTEESLRVHSHTLPRFASKITMLELIFLFIVIPKRMTRLARERNRSALKWTLATIGVWLAVEIVVGVVLILAVFLSTYLLGTPEDPEQISSLMYIPALIAALVSAEFMIRRLRAKPSLPPSKEIQTLDLA